MKINQGKGTILSSDDPIEPIHRIDEMENRRTVNLRSRAHHLFSRYLENLLGWKRFELSKERNKAKLRRNQPQSAEKSPGDPTDRFA